MENQLREGRFRLLTKDGGAGSPRLRSYSRLPDNCALCPFRSPLSGRALPHSAASAHRAHVSPGASKAYNTAFLANAVNARNSLEVRSPKQEHGFSNGLNRLHSGSVFYYMLIFSHSFTFFLTMIFARRGYYHRFQINFIGF